jgi:hypothetical protein
LPDRPFHRDELVHEVLLSDAVADLHPDLLAGVGARDVCVFDLQRIHGLFHVRRRSLDLYRVADRNPVVREADCRDADLPIEVEDFADFLPFERHRGCMGPPR